MRRFLLPLVGLLAASLTLGACEFSVVPVAARVNGVPISVASLNAALNSALNDPGYRCSVTGGSSSVTGAGSHTFTAAFTANELGFFTSAAALHQELAAADIRTNTAIATDVGKIQLVDTFTPQSGSTCTEAGSEVVAGLNPSYRTTLIQYYADEATLAAHLLGITLTNAGLHHYELAHTKTVDVDCVDAVVTTSLATAQSVVNQLRKGADFSAVAKANSVDSASASNGGRIGCITPEQLQGPLGPLVETLAPGVISSPVKYESYWVVFEVASRSLPSPVNALLALAATETSSSEFSATLTRLVDRATVEVSSAYGTATVSQGAVRVKPLSGPPTKFISNVSALSLSLGS